MQVVIKEFSTEETRAKAVEEAKRVRRERVKVFNELKNRNITAERILFNLDNEYDFMKRVRTKRFLMAFDGIGSSTAEKIIRELGIAENRRLQGLGVHQKTNLILAIEQYKW